MKSCRSCFFILGLVYSVIAGCSSVSSITKVVAFQYLPIFTNETKSGTDTFYLNSFYYKKWVIYSVPVYSLPIESKNISSFRYLILQKDSIWGYQFEVKDGIPQFTRDKLLVDSFINKYSGLNKINAFQAYSSTGIKLLSTNGEAGNDRLVEKYKLTSLIDTTDFATLFFSFATADSFSKVTLSLSKELDSLKNRKLVEYVIVQPQKYRPEYKMVVPAFEVKYQLVQESVDLQQQKALLSYFNHYERDISK